MQTLFFPSGSETIAGNLFAPKEKNSFGVLILHGGGNSNKERFMDIQIALEKAGIASLAIDFMGVGQSTGEFKDGSLANRLQNAKDALQKLKEYADPRQLAVYGSSMGGYLAPLVAISDAGVKAIILSAAAAYSPDAEDKKLDNTFTQVITKPNNWEHAKSFTAFEEFKGKVLVLYGQGDAIIPKEIQERYAVIARKKGESYFIPFATHNIVVANDPEEKEAKQTAITHILSFLTTI